MKERDFTKTLIMSKPLIRLKKKIYWRVATSFIWKNKRGENFKGPF
jgi:hypothetical protein